MPVRRRRATGARQGVTVVEVLVAMMILTFGLLGMAGFSMSLSKQFKSSSKQETAALMVQSRLDSASIGCLAFLGPQSSILVRATGDEYHR
jgi:Tfp pilus assembly protein PilV